MMGQVERPALECFARILDYPRADLAAAVQSCEALVAPQNPAAAALLAQFRDFATQTPLTRMEEIYTATFDLNAACCPYVGHYLFGECHKRSIFMLELKARYREQGFQAANELPDHLAVLLSFLAACRDPALADEIIRDAVLPALRQMAPREREDEAAAGSPEGPGQVGPYGWVLDALRLVMEGV